jgi:hypothetical protein
MLNSSSLIKKARILNPNIIILENERPEFWIINITASLLEIALQDNLNQWNDLK